MITKFKPKQHPNIIWKRDLQRIMYSDKKIVITARYLTQPQLDRYNYIRESTHSEDLKGKLPDYSNISFDTKYNTNLFSDPILEDFTEFIKHRITYLDSLYNLDDDWISGNSAIPNAVVIELSKDLLNGFLNYILDKKEIRIPKILMSPIPIGGFGFDISTNDRNSLSISLYNDGTNEIELQKDDYFSEIEIKQSLLNEIIKGFELIVQ